MNFRDKNLDCVNYDNDNGFAACIVRWWWCTDVNQFAFSSEGCFKFGKIFKLPTQTHISCAGQSPQPTETPNNWEAISVFSRLSCIDSCGKRIAFRDPPPLPPPRPPHPPHPPHAHDSDDHHLMLRAPPAISRCDQSPRAHACARDRGWFRWDALHRR